MDATIIAAAIDEHYKLDNQIRDYLYRKLYKLYNEKNLHGGNLPQNKKAEDALYIRSFSFFANQIDVGVDIWWGGDIYDSINVNFPIEIWNVI